MKIFLFIFLSCITASFAQNDAPPVTETENGKVEGIFDAEENLDVYLGIPFAQPPVGELRWKAPQPAENYEGILQAKKFSPAPVQANVFGDMQSRGDGQSEDCLYLNIWTPHNKAPDGLPVLVYFYGGGFVAGDASEPRYDGASIAQKGIVVVTTNYRLNIFGFLAHPELSAEADYNASGNYGLLDQHAALQWVKENISAFGGDPDRVIIAGESAGSMSVSAQMASPLSRDLIAGAIGESGAAIKPTMPPVPLDEAEKTGVEFVKSISYNSIADLRALNTSELFELYKKSGRFGFPSVTDNYFLPASLPKIFEAEKQAQIPLLLGWNSAEIPGTALMQGLAYSEENYIQKLKENFPEDYEKVLELYPSGSVKEIELSATALASDRFISYSTWKWFDLHRKNSEQPVYRYLYSKKRPPLTNQNLNPGLAEETVEKENDSPVPPEPIGAPHAAEIEYFMGNLPLLDTYNWTKEDYLVSETIQQYLANFIKTGNPNGQGLPQWPPAEKSDTNPPVLIIDTVTRINNAEVDNRYQFLDRFYGNKQ